MDDFICIPLVDDCFPFQTLKFVSAHFYTAPSPPPPFFKEMNRHSTDILRDSPGFSGILFTMICGWELRVTVWSPELNPMNYLQWQEVVRRRSLIPSPRPAWFTPSRGRAARVNYRRAAAPGPGAPRASTRNGSGADAATTSNTDTSSCSLSSFPFTSSHESIQFDNIYLYF